MAFKLMTDDDLMRVRTPATMREFSDPGAAQQRAFSARKIMADTGYETKSMAPGERQSYERKIMDLSAQEQMRSQEQRTRDQFVEPARIQGRALVDAAKWPVWGQVGAAMAEASGNVEAERVKAAALPKVIFSNDGKSYVDPVTGKVVAAPREPTLEERRQQELRERAQKDIDEGAKAGDLGYVVSPDGKFYRNRGDLDQNTGGFNWKPIAGSNFGVFPQVPQVGGAEAGTAGTDGRKPLSDAEARLLLQQAGGDKERARAMAKERGYAI